MVVEYKSGRRGPAVTSLVLGIIALLLCLIPIINNVAAVLAIVGLVFGVVGWRGASKKLRAGRGMAIAGTILAVVSMAGVIASQMVYSKAIGDVSKNVNRAFGGATADVLAKDLTVSIGKYSTEDKGFGIRDGALRVTLTNKSHKRESFDIQVEAVTASGTRISTDRGSVSNLNPGQSDEISMFDFASGKDMDQLKSATFQVIEASAY